MVNENKNRPKKLWQILKEVGSSTKCKTKESSISLDIGNELCFDKVKVATHFNDFFTSNAASLVNKLPACSGKFGQSHVVEFYRNTHVTEDMFSLANVNVGQVSKILHSMSSRKATRLDEIPAKYLKNVADIESTLSSELEYVSNWLIDNKLSLHLGKTQSILFGMKRRLNTGVKFNVICNGNVIESKSNVTYFGVTLDQFLSGEIIASNIL